LASIPARVEAALGPRTRAILPIHLFGRCAGLPRLQALADARGIALVEDAAQSHRRIRAGRRAGAWGRAGCFSFYPSKNLGGVGDGGCVTTDDPEVAERVRLYRSHGSSRDGAHVVPGTTARLDALQAAALRAKLPFLDGWTRLRARNARIIRRSSRAARRSRFPSASSTDAGLEPVHHPLSRCRERARGARGGASSGGTTIRCRPHRNRLSAPRAAPREVSRGGAGLREVISLPVRPSCSPATIEQIADVIRRAVAR
jgi:dTDP-4-amino-4,6-dideoxygalactose transaminase